MKTVAVPFAAMFLSSCSCTCNPPAPDAVEPKAVVTVPARRPGAESPPAHPPAPPAEVTDLSTRGLPVSLLVPPYATLFQRTRDDGRTVVELSKSDFHLEIVGGPAPTLDAWAEPFVAKGARVERRVEKDDAWAVVVTRDEQTFAYATAREGVTCQALGLDKNLLKQVEKLCATVQRSKASPKQPQ